MVNESPHNEINTVTEISCMIKLLCSPGNKLLCSLLHSSRHSVYTNVHGDNFHK